jgi:hypothetical protein
MFVRQSLVAYSINSPSLHINNAMLDTVTLDFARKLSLQYAPANGNSLPFASVQFVPVVSFQVFTPGVAQIMLVWVLTPCRIVSLYRRFGCCTIQLYQIRSP